MRPMTQFYIHLKGIKPKRGRQNSMTRMTKKQILKLMEKHNYIIMDGLIYDESDNIVGSLVRKTTNKKAISAKEFEKDSLLKIMNKLGFIEWKNNNSNRGFGIRGVKDRDQLEQEELYKVY